MPLLLLAGRDRGTTRLPEEGHQLLKGYKSLDLQVAGRPLIAELADRLRASGAFDPLWIAGPAKLYEGIVEGARLVDTDGAFGDNLQAGVEAVRAAHDDLPLGVMTSDILPDPGELETVIDDYRRHVPCDFWMSEIQIPEDLTALGKSAWKPKYHIRPRGTDTAMATLPGHLVIVDPATIRLHLLYRIFDLAYQTRNRRIDDRRWAIARGALSVLLGEDLGRLFRGRLPLVTFQMLYHGLHLGNQLRKGSVAQEELEDRLRKIWVDDRHRARFRQRRGRVALLDTLSLARDIDTVEEARELLDNASPSPTTN